MHTIQSLANTALGCGCRLGRAGYLYSSVYYYPDSNLFAYSMQLLAYYIISYSGFRDTPPATVLDMHAKSANFVIYIAINHSILHSNPLIVYEHVVITTPKDCFVAKRYASQGDFLIHQCLQCLFVARS